MLKLVSFSPQIQTAASSHEREKGGGKKRAVRRKREMSGFGAECRRLRGCLGGGVTRREEELRSGKREEKKKRRKRAQQHRRGGIGPAVIYGRFTGWDRSEIRPQGGVGGWGGLSFGASTLMLSEPKSWKSS